MVSKMLDLLIVGGRIVGLARALEAAQRFPRLRLLVVEKESEVAAHQSNHNSGVFHSGLYYRSGSIKAQTCVEGTEAMLALCRQHGIPHEICGKVVMGPRRSGSCLPWRSCTAAGGRMACPTCPSSARKRLREIEPHSRGLRAL